MTGSTAKYYFCPIIVDENQLRFLSEMVKERFGEVEYGIETIDGVQYEYSSIDDLLAYNYTEVHRDYQGVTGVTASASTVSQHINAGVSIVNYCNHGYETGWGVFSYSNSHVNALTNDYKLPYIISVACLNGKYDRNGDCFAEAWMRATNNSTGNPTGAIGGMFSYISQPWQPPMYGQDEMVDILVESYENNIKRTMGGVSINGNMKVLDLGASQNANKGTYNTWILYGDPTLTLRTAVPASMNVSCASAMESSATTFNVSVTNAEGALATLSLDGEILGSAVVTNGSAGISFEAPGRTGEATLTVFGYNKKTYVTTVDVTDGTLPPLMVLAFADPGTIKLGETITLTANASGGTGNYSYFWEPKETIESPHNAVTLATPTEIGIMIYTVIVNDGENTASAEVEVEVLEPAVVVCPTPKDFSGASYYDEGEFGARLSWDSAPYEFTLDRFEIYRSDNGIDFKRVKTIVNTPSITHYECVDVVSEAGLYFYRIVAFYQNDCESDPVDIDVVIIDYTSVDENDAENVAVYPNPTTGNLNIEANGIQQVSVVNMMGQTVNCVTGRSGEGKTTLLNICMGLRLPDKGSVIYNKIDIHEGKNTWIYKKIALIEQEPFIFEGSVGDNIFLGRKEDPEKALQMLRTLQLQHLANTVNELNTTMIGGRYRQLSTGEKQRLAVIRAAIRDIDVIFLDEATSNIDTNNTKILIDFINELAKEKLIISVSHDMSFISNSTNVFILENGSLTQK